MSAKEVIDIVSTIITLGCTIALVVIYNRQRKIMDAQLGLQKKSVDFGPAKLLQSLYNSLRQLDERIKVSEELCLFQPDNFKINCTSLIQSKKDATAQYYEEIKDLRFIVSDTTYKELISYGQISDSLCNNLFNLLAPAVTTIDWSEEYDLIFRSYKEHKEFDEALNIDNYILQYKALDKGHPVYDEYLSLRIEYECRFNELIKKFETNFGYGGLL